MNRITQKMFGVLVALLAIATLVTGLYSIRNQERIARCQANYNHAFIEQLRVRTDISNSDRESLADTVQGMLDPANGREARRKILEEYLKTKEENDAKRQKHPLPDLPQDAAC